MNYMVLPFLIVMAVSLGAGFLASRKGKDFFLAGRTLRWPMLFGTFVGTQVGGGFILGNSDASFQHGLFGSMYGLGLALGMLFLGLGYGARLRTLNISTMPELLQERYGSVAMRKVASLLSVVSLVGILMCQAIGLFTFLKAMGNTGLLLYLLSWGVVVVYTTCGGLLAVVWTDAIQVIVMVIMLVVTFLTTLLPNLSIIVDQAAVMSGSWTGVTMAPLLISCCFIFIEQDMAQRCFAAKTPRDVTTACILTAVSLTLLTVIPTCCGLLGQAMGLKMQNGSIFVQVVRLFSSPAVFTVAASSVLLAIVSTASSVLLAASSNLVHDLIKKEKGSKELTLLLGLVALSGPFLSGDIVASMVFSYEISVGALLVPIVMAVLTNRRYPQEAAWGSVLCGSVGTLLAHAYGESMLMALLPIALAFIGFFCGSLLGSRKRALKLVR